LLFLCQNYRIEILDILVDLLVIVLEKTKSPENFTKKLIDVVVKNFRIVKSQVIDFPTLYLSDFQYKISEKRTDLLKSIQEFVSCSWVNKEVQDIKFYLTVSKFSNLYLENNPRAVFIIILLLGKSC